MSDDAYRWCIHCGADCWPPPEEQTHGVICPVTTGLWPVREQDLEGGMRCGECGGPFSVGESYVLRDTDSGEVCSGAAVSDGAVLLIICSGCAVISPDESREDES